MSFKGEHKIGTKKHNIIYMYIRKEAQAWHRNGKATEFLIWTKNEHRIGLAQKSTNMHRKAKTGT
jgi:hypothetical protein